MRIICFGDSNTFGYDSVTKGRFSESQRWCGILRGMLGDGSEVIERGLNGRTICTDDMFVPGRNGMKAIDNEVFGCGKTDLLIVMLGTNDCKSCFSLDADSICAGMEKMIDELSGCQDIRNILLLSPVPMNDNCSKGFMGFGKNSAAISESLAGGYEKIAMKYGIEFTDTSTWGIELTEDGCHYTVQGHKKFASRIYDIVKAIADR